MVMKKAVVVSLSVLIGVALVSAVVLGSNFLPRTGGKVEDLDKFVARVVETANAGHFAAGLEAQDCQASTPLHIGALVLDFLDGKPVLVCVRSLEPAAKLDKPLAVVDLDHRQFDPIARSLPAAFLAPDLNAASTIIFTRCSKSQVGRYGYILRHAAYRQDCGLLFVRQDGASAMQILGIMSFSASPPEKIDARFTFGDVVADRPEFQMQDYIAYRSTDATKMQQR
jgi:hypothetical protein